MIPAQRPKTKKKLVTHVPWQAPKKTIPKKRLTRNLQLREKLREMIER